MTGQESNLWFPMDLFFFSWINRPYFHMFSCLAVDSMRRRDPRAGFPKDFLWRVLGHTISQSFCWVQRTKSCALAREEIVWNQLQGSPIGSPPPCGSSITLVFEDMAVTQWDPEASSPS